MKPSKNLTDRTQAKERAEAVRGIILDLTLRGELDVTDLRIISARDCSPMPSMDDVARTIGLSTRQTMRRMSRIKELVINEL